MEGEETVDRADSSMLTGGGSGELPLCIGCTCGCGPTSPKSVERCGNCLEAFDADSVGEFTPLPPRLMFPSVFAALVISAPSTCSGSLTSGLTFLDFGLLGSSDFRFLSSPLGVPLGDGGVLFWFWL